jgi:hypothetical protein
VPITFLAHQAPVLPLLRRWGFRLDGVALCIGTMSPDFAYVVSRTPLTFWAHTLVAILWFCIPVTLLVSWLTVRVLAPVVPDHLPTLGPFRLRDYRGVATHRFRPLAATLGAAFGAWTHVALDAMTHSYVWVAVNLPPMVRPIGPWRPFGAGVSVYRVSVWAAHVGLSAASVFMLYRFGKAGWMAARSAEVPPVRATRRSHVLLWGTATCITVPFGYLATRTLRDIGAASIFVMRISALLFGGLCLGSIAVKRSRRRWPR